VPAGSITRFAVMRNGKELFSAPGYALPIGAVESDRCEVPGQPCYDPPDGMVALVDGSAFPSVPSTNTSVAAGHSNRFHPNDPRRGVFTRLLDVRPGDILVVTTTKGVFTYLVVDAKEIPFDQTATSDVMTDRVANRFIAITCKISPDYSRYTGNFVVVSTLIASRPLN
jgi:LPXTG-site transpeptidase (sortase) family protein